MIVLAVLPGAAPAQFAPAEVVAVQSFSGQFMVRAPRAVRLPTIIANLATNREFVRLEPALLTVSCERIKQALANEMGSFGSWKGRVYLKLHPTARAEEPITITAHRFKNVWQYGVELPDVVRRERFVRAMVQVLLLERANRDAGTRSAELPQWLAEGLTQQLLASNEIEIILPPPRPNSKGLLITSRVISARRENPLAQAHKELSTRQPLTFDELSWPPADPAPADTIELYRCSAQLFVSELLRLRNGRPCLQAMLAELPQRYNWQTAFFDAFSAHFQRPLDVEKWWALRAARFTGRALTKSWLPPESWQKLFAAVHPAVQVRSGTNDLPLRTEVTLQEVVRAWDVFRQTEVLNATVREVALIQPRLAPEFAALADEYRQTLQTYLPRMPQAVPAYRAGKKPRLGRPVADALRQLDDLDARLERLRPPPPPPATPPTASSP